MLNWHFESNMAFAMKGGRFYPRNTLKCIDMFSKHFDVWHFGSHTIPSPTCNVCYNISANGTPPRRWSLSHNGNHLCVSHITLLIFDALPAAVLKTGCKYANFRPPAARLMHQNAFEIG